MLTYKNMIKEFEDIASNHLQLNSFVTGPIDEVDIEKLDATNFPFLYIESTGVIIDQGVLTYSFSIMVADQVAEDFSNRDNVYSQALLILKDVIAEFKQNLSSTSSVDNECVLQLPINAEPFTAKFANSLTGWQGNVSIEVNNKNNLCIAPIS